MKKNLGIILTGSAIGIVSVILVVLGNPANMGFCNACFLRDIAGALGLHRAEVVQYVRPEIIGLVLGALIMAFVGKEYKVKGGSSPVTRFVLGFFVMVGALMFLGCPLRMILRMAGGDLNAIIGLAGFVAGILGGSFLLNKGFSLKRSYTLGNMEGFIFPAINFVLLILLVAAPSVLIFSQSGPGSMRAPIIASLAAGLIVGALAQRTRFCMAAGIRDSFLLKDFYMLYGLIAMVVVALIGNAITGKLNIGFADQPVAHTDGLWNFLGMALVGLGSVMLGGCPLRQIILAGSGNSDSAITVIGLVAGAAFCHNFGLASSAKGPTPAGQIAVIIGFAVLLVIAFGNMQKSKE